MKTLRRIGLAGIIASLVGCALPAKAETKLDYVPGHAIVQFEKDPFIVSQNFVDARRNAYESIPRAQVQVSNRGLESALDNLGISVINPLTPGARGLSQNTYLLSFDPNKSVSEVVSSLQGLANIKLVEPDSIAQAQEMIPPNMTTEQYTHKNTSQTIVGQPGISGADLRSTFGWDYVLNATNNGQDCETLIAIIDTGTDLSDPVLSGRIWANGAENPTDGIDNDGNGLKDDVNGWNFVSNNPNVTYVDGHGVYMSRIAVGNGPSGVGSAWMDGARAIIYKVSDNGASFNVANRIAALNQVVKEVQMGRPIKVVNLSYGGTLPTAELNSLIDVNNAGVVISAGAGNDGINQLFYPAAYWATDGRLMNFAVTGLSNTDVLPSFATTGDHVNIATYAENVWGLPGFIDGTSGATALMSGLVADAFVANPGLQRDDIYTIFFNTWRTPLSNNPRCSENTSNPTCNVANLQAALDVATLPPFCNVSGLGIASDHPPLVGGDPVETCLGEVVNFSGSATRNTSCGGLVYRWSDGGSFTNWDLSNVYQSNSLQPSFTVTLESKLGFERDECAQSVGVQVEALPHILSASSPSSVQFCQGVPGDLTGGAVVNPGCASTTARYRWVGPNGQDSGVQVSSSYGIAVPAPVDEGVWTLYASSLEDSVEKMSTTVVSLVLDVPPDKVKHVKVVKSGSGLDISWENNGSFGYRVQGFDKLQEPPVFSVDVSGGVYELVLTDGELPQINGPVYHVDVTGLSCSGSQGPR